MKKLFLIISLMIFANLGTHHVDAAGAAPEAIVPDAVEIIPNASYYVPVGENQESYSTNFPTKNVAFYTFDGKLIQEVPHHSNFEQLKKMLDPHAPKPQPTSSKIRYWSNGQIKYLGITIGETGEAGWYITFYDKHGNRIDTYRCSDKGTTISKYTCIIDGFPFDKNNPNVIDEAFHLDLSALESVAVESKLENKLKPFKKFFLINKGGILLTTTGLIILKATYAACELKLKGKKSVSKTEYAKTFANTFVELSKNLIKHPITSAQQQKFFTTGVAALLGGGILIKLNS